MMHTTNVDNRNSTSYVAGSRSGRGPPDRSSVPISTLTDIAGSRARLNRGDTVRETTSPRHRAPIFFMALLALIALVVAACGGSSGGSSGSGGGGGGGSSDKPVYGGKITYALEGNTVAFCPPTGQWAISGIEVAEAVYDTLTRPTRDPNVYAPYLAKSVEPQRRLHRSGPSCCGRASSSRTARRSTPTP